VLATLSKWRPRVQIPLGGLGRQIRGVRLPYGLLLLHDKPDAPAKDSYPFAGASGLWKDGFLFQSDSGRVRKLW
jgi:hypothetical protein